MNKINRGKIKSLFWNYLIPVFIVLLSVYYFSRLLGLNGILAYNDYVLPKSLSDLDSYISNSTIYNFTYNLGSIRSNFFSELPTLYILKLLTFFFEYQLATKITQIASYCVPSLFCYFIFRKINHSPAVSLVCSLLLVYNLWSYDRLQQGHFYLLGPFLCVLMMILYFRYFSKYKFRNIILGHLLFLGLLTYYHYTIIVIYFLLIDFIFLLFKKENKWKLIKEHFVLGGIFLIDSMIFILPYLGGSLSTFENLSKNVSNAHELSLFSWQSMAISELYHIRLGMYSYKMVSENYLLIFILIGFIGFYIIFLKKIKNSLRLNRLILSFFFLGFLGFGIWLNYDFFNDFIYKIPTFAIFRDMNKFVGISYVFFLTIICIKAPKIFKRKNGVYYKLLFYSSSILSLCICLFPFNQFLVYNQDELYNIQDSSIFTVAVFPSYPLTSVTYNDVYFHKYLPSLVSTNGFRSISIPYEVTIENYKYIYSVYKDIYTNFESYTADQVFEKLSNFGVKYIYYYKRYPFKSNSSEIDTWYHEVDIKNKFGIENLIIENNDITIYKIPKKYIKEYIIAKNDTNILSSHVTQTEIELMLESKNNSIIDQIANYDQNWKIELLPITSNNDLTYFEPFKSIRRVFGQYKSVGEITKNSNGLNSYIIKNEEIFETGSKYLAWNGSKLHYKVSLFYLPNSLFIFGFCILSLNIIGSIIYIFIKKNE